uniref:phosphatidylinositol-3,5-bisphosphate 3-phosphatase n=1 Tax=Myripristis murdjan TaxID=586833 RepID=A0A667ZRL9_9TELE
QEEEGQQSLECIQANQIFPKKSPVLEEENMQVPFPELHGEFTEYVGRAEDAIIAMSSYRLHIKFKESVVNIPLQLIESVECRDMFQLQVTCKDCKVVRCQFSTFEQCQEWLKRLTGVVRPPSRLEDLFSFAFHAWCMEVYAGEKEQHGELCRPGEHVTSWFKNEVERMGFDTQNAWRISDINSKLCSSYPQQLLVPAWITDKELENVAAFRSWKRFPAVVYRLSTGAVIARCGQPEVSWWGWRNADDEHLVQSIAKACAVDSSSRKHLANGSYTNGPDLPDTDFESSMTNSSEVETLAIQPHKLLILDARSYAAAVANRAKGGGCECPEYYPNCEVVFMGMANIHSIRKSFQSLRFLCTQMPDPANWLSALESTKWLQHLSLLLKAALLVVNAVDRDHRPVLVHCSDGWDRTPQIAALSKLLLDPYYRTIEGFQVLVEAEWLDFGHKFADRCGHGENSEDLNERCPVFLQWLDCVHQLQRQFPCSFEFNEAFLVKLVQHTYSCLFGTFLCNSGKEREDRHVQERTCSVWSLLRPANRTLRNMLYSSHSETVCSLFLTLLHASTSLLHYWLCFTLVLATPNKLALQIKTWGGPDQEGRANGQPGAGPYSDTVDNELDDSPQPEVPLADLGQGASQGSSTAGEDSEEAELSVAAGVAEGQMENILQEATKEEAGADAQREGSAGGSNTEGSNTDLEVEANIEEVDQYAKVNGTEMQTEPFSNGHHPENGLVEAEEDSFSLTSAPLPTEVAEQPEEQAAEEAPLSEGLVMQLLENCSLQEELKHRPSHPDNTKPDQPAGHRTITNGFGDEPPEAAEAVETACRDPESNRDISEPVEQADKRASLMESSTETLTEEACSRLELPAQPPVSLGPQPCNEGRSQHPCLRKENGLESEAEHGAARTLNGGSKRPSLSAFQSVSAEPSREGLCNGESSDGDPSSGPHWAKVNGERTLLSRQVSLASCNSLSLHHRGSCSQHRCCHVPLGRAAASPEQPSRSHLDDDGLTLHTDAIQQRLRQIEAGHQMEVETLKKQVQELWSRLENQHHAGSLRINGDMGDELFSEASWEQVDKQDTEVTRWYPDHLAAQCYGCERSFWLATRKHHCRNCGNVFCASCCDQKIPVPSQQLFEPSRVCKSCYSSLQLNSAPMDLELEKTITASSN